MITVSESPKKFLNTGRNPKIGPDHSLVYLFSYSLQKNCLLISAKTAALCDPQKNGNLKEKIPNEFQCLILANFEDQHLSFDKKTSRVIKSNTWIFS